MENAQVMIQALAFLQTFTEDTKAAVQERIQAAGSAKRTNREVTAASMSTRTRGPSLKQLTFTWTFQDKYKKLLSFDMGVNNIFMTKGDNISESDRVPIIRNSL